MQRKIEYPSLKEDRAIKAAAFADPDSQPLSNEMLAKMRPVRGQQKTATKELISIRLDPDLVAELRNSGKGWQGRANTLLREALGM